MPSHSAALVAETDSETIRFACTDQSKNLDTYGVRRQNLKACSNKKLSPGEEVEPQRTTSVRDNGSHNATFFEAVRAANCEAQFICTVCGNRLPEIRASGRMHAYAAPKKNPVLQTGGLWMMR